MSTIAQDAANLANAQHSTGPTSAEGKQRSSRNALKHGLTAQAVLLPGEDPDAYAALADGFHQDFQPANTLESALVEQLTNLQWRLLRIPALEAKILSADNPDYKALNNISLHAARMKREFSATLKELRELAAARAVPANQSSPTGKQPCPAAPIGFDFLDNYVAEWIRNETAPPPPPSPSQSPDPA